LLKILPIATDSTLDKLRKAAIPLPTAERSQLVERNPALAQAHQAAAAQGDTPAPDARDDVDLHYVCFVRTEDPELQGAGILWELDGRRKGPLKRGNLAPGEDVLSERALTIGPLKFLEREGADLRFSAVALAQSLD
jgi:ubiquitin carboxyl-terminal hydrolase L3